MSKHNKARLDLATLRAIPAGIWALGIVVVLLVTALRILWRAYSASQASRLTDKDAVVTTLTGLVEKATSALVSSTTAGEHSFEMLREIRDALRALSDLVRSEGVGRRDPKEPRP